MASFMMTLDLAAVLARALSKVRDASGFKCIGLARTGNDATFLDRKTRIDASIPRRQVAEIART